MKRYLTLLLALMLLAACALGCAQPATQNEPGAATDAPAATAAPVAQTLKPAQTQQPSNDVPDEELEPQTFEYTQSPWLEDKGLAPVVDRLPTVPKLTNEVPPELLDYQIGKYGGTFRSATTSLSYDAEVFIMMNEPVVNSPSFLGNEVTGNIFEGYEVTEDNKVFTFKLREGLKWSDGEPVTMEDVRFSFEDILGNATLSTAGYPNWLRTRGKAQGNPAVFEIIDDWTFRLTFDESYGGFLMSAAVEGWRGYDAFLQPAHYMKQFHADYADPTELAKLVADNGYEEGKWESLFNQKLIVGSEGISEDAMGCPGLWPWILVEHTESYARLERNPYYFKVDSEGQQLPYIDEIITYLVNDIEMVNMKILAGELDHSYEYAVMSKVAMYKEYEAQSNIRLMTNLTLHRTPGSPTLNLNLQDDVLGPLFRDAEFRRAFSMAIDRQEIADSVFLGYAKPFSYQSEYNVEEANKILDNLGLVKGADGLRTTADGEKIDIELAYNTTGYSDFQMQTELVVANLEQVGIKVTGKGIAGSLLSERRAANEIVSFLFDTPAPVMWYRPEWRVGQWALLWNNWWTNGGVAGDHAEEPPEEMKEFLQLQDDLRVYDVAGAKGVYEKIMDNFSKNNWFFITVQDVAQPVVVRASLQNFPDQGMAIAQSFGAEQWWFDE